MNKGICFFVAVLLAMTMVMGQVAWAEGADMPDAIPRIDSSTARIPITDAIYALLKDTYKLDGPAPICSKTHGAWLNLADKKVDVLFTVAPTADEFNHFQAAGVDIEMKVYGYDALVFIGNKNNRCSNLSGEEIREIYSGKVTDWYNVGGSLGDTIEVYIRNPESGSQRLFEQLVWDGYEIPDFARMGFLEGEIDPTVKQFTADVIDDMEGIASTVIAHQYAIGYNIMSYIDDKYLNPKTEDGEPQQVVCATGSVNLRTGPGLSFDTVGALETGECLPYLNETDYDERDVTWFKAQHPEKGEVWVSEKFCAITDAPTTDLKVFSVDEFAPTTENIASGKYPYVTTSYIAIRADEPKDSPARKLFDWVGSAESEKLFKEQSTLAVSFGDSVVLRTKPQDFTENEALKDLMAALDARELSWAELRGLDLDQVRALRQGVYAKSGMTFPWQPYQDYFAQFDWYKPAGGTDKMVERRFNEAQTRNLALIRQYEQALRRAAANVEKTPVLTEELYFTDDEPMQSDEMMQVQRALAACGYLDAADCTGIGYEQTGEAVSRFRKDHGLFGYFVVDQALYELLMQ